MEIELNNISHSYVKGNPVLKNINIKFSRGITGILGVNGAGKSTLLNLLSTTMNVQKGDYKYRGYDIRKSPKKMREVLGYLPQYFGSSPEFTPTDFLMYLGLLKGASTSYLKSEIPHLLKVLNLTHVKGVKIKDMSGGTRQRLGIAQALLNKPEILILDEPMVGLDPNERHNFNALLAELAEHTIILISTHIVDDIQNLCEQIVVLDKGELLYNGVLNGLVAKIEGLAYEKKMPRVEFESFKNKYTILRTKPVGNELLVRFIATQENTGTKIQPTLEDAFLYLTKLRPNG